VFGAWCAMGGTDRLSGVLKSRITLTVAIAYLVFAFLIAMTWHIPVLGQFVPDRLASLIYPIDKTNLDVLRFAHFLALGAVIVWFIPRDWSALQWPIFRPAIWCGQHSLEIFCLGVFLAFAAHFAMGEISGGVAMQVAVSVIGVGLMIGAAGLLTWYKSIEGRNPGSRTKSTDADMAGGEA
jgi:hypothetical protein